MAQSKNFEKRIRWNNKSNYTPFLQTETLRGNNIIGHSPRSNATDSNQRSNIWSNECSNATDSYQRERIHNYPYTQVNESDRHTLSRPMNQGLNHTSCVPHLSPAQASHVQVRRRQASQRSSPTAYKGHLSTRAGQNSQFYKQKEERRHYFQDERSMQRNIYQNSPNISQTNSTSYCYTPTEEEMDYRFNRVPSSNQPSPYQRQRTHPGHRWYPSSANSYYQPKYGCSSTYRSVEDTGYGAPNYPQENNSYPGFSPNRARIRDVNTQRQSYYRPHVGGHEQFRRFENSIENTPINNHHIESIPEPTFLLEQVFEDIASMEHGYRQETIICPIRCMLLVPEDVVRVLRTLPQFNAPKFQLQGVLKTIVTQFLIQVNLYENHELVKWCAPISMCAQLAAFERNYQKLFNEYLHPRRDPRSPTKLFLKRVPPSWNRDVILKIFGQIGQICRIDTFDLQRNGHAFVEYVHSSDAQIARLLLHKIKFRMRNQKNLRVVAQRSNTCSYPREPKVPTLVQQLHEIPIHLS